MWHSCNSGSVKTHSKPVAPRTPRLETPIEDMWDWVHPANWFASEADLLRFCGLWGFFVLLGAFEALFPAIMQPPERGRRWPANLGLGLVTMAIAPLPPLFATVAAEWAQKAGVGLFNSLNTNWPAAALATVAICSLATYGFHVLMHKVPLLWNVHRVHHLDTHLDVSTTLRSHPLELAAKTLVVVPVSVVFGLTPAMIILYETIQSFIDVFSHTNVELPHRVDRALRWLIVTPNMHSIHHSSHQPETDSNYSQVLSVWDRLFGTYTADTETARPHREIGLKEIRDGRISDFWWQIKSPFLR
jgi:sterol desaturase/sphingolipid hydroxylase (fatty acid hydroxylase superfamily)